MLSSLGRGPSASAGCVPRDLTPVGTLVPLVGVWSSLGRGPVASTSCLPLVRTPVGTQVPLVRVVSSLGRGRMVPGPPLVLGLAISLRGPVAVSTVVIPLAGSATFLLGWRGSFRELLLERLELLPFLQELREGGRASGLQSSGEWEGAIGLIHIRQ